MAPYQERERTLLRNMLGKVMPGLRQGWVGG
jgi:hypothetical protein